ncbi:MAG TPA: right-handed parallel beta-helix repeat-containing protein, partial [bacterium]|nr:right-handed parallel beta-helix repeat-containing protein [bacterium]
MRPKFVLTALVILSVSSVASADYSTPGAGTSYTLADLAQIAPEVVQQETDFNFRILDKLTIAASDELKIFDSFVTMATRQSVKLGWNSTDDFMPIIEIEGRIQAGNTIFRADVSSEYENAPHALVLRTSQSDQPSGVIEDCTFERFFTAITARHPGQVFINSCRFNECYSIGVHAFQESHVEISDCVFYNCAAVSAEGTVKIRNCRAEGGGITLSSIGQGSEIADNVLIGPGQFGLLVVGTVTPTVERCQISGFQYGLIVEGSGEAQFESNSIWGNRYGAVLFTDYARIRMRRNQIVHNTAEILDAKGAVSMPAICIDLNATVDLGTTSSPGFNI